jgi:hypothetical protein
MAYHPDQDVAVDRQPLQHLTPEKQAWLMAQARSKEPCRPPCPPPPGVPFYREIERVDEMSAVLYKTIEELRDRLSGLMAPSNTNGSPNDNDPRPDPRPLMAPLVERVREIGNRIEAGIAQLRALLDGLQV